MGKKRKKSILTAEQWAEIHENTRRLRERIEYHRAKLREERERAGGRDASAS